MGFQNLQMLFEAAAFNCIHKPDRSRSAEPAEKVDEDRQRLDFSILVQQLQDFRHTGH